MGRTERDEAIVAAFLEAVHRLTDAEAGRESGISAERIRQYRRGEWTRLHGSTRRRLEDYVAGPGEGGTEEILAHAARLRRIAADLVRLAERSKTGGI